MGVSLPPGLSGKVLVASGDAAPGQGRVRVRPGWRVYGFL